MHLDFMIKLDRGIPPNGMEVLVRLEGSDRMTVNGVYEDETFQIPAPEGKQIVSWFPASSRCKCLSRRWSDNKETGKCNGCGIDWIQHESAIAI